MKANPKDDEALFLLCLAVAGIALLGLGSGRWYSDYPMWGSGFALLLLRRSRISKGVALVGAGYCLVRLLVGINELGGGF
ncbi:MAG: hypothetical protein ACON4R_12245 [Akkermansiaceae bacterium]